METVVDLYGDISLFIEFKSTGSIEVRNQLVQKNIGLAKRIARTVAENSHLEYEDLEQVSSLELVKAVERFDPSRGCRFATFAVPFIRGRLLNYCRDRGFQVRSPRSDYEIVQKLKRARQAHPEKSDKEVALIAGIPLDKLNSALAAMQRCRYTRGIDQLNEAPYQSLPDVAPDFEISLSQLSAQANVVAKQYFFWGIKISQICASTGISSTQVKALLRESLEQSHVSAWA